MTNMETYTKTFEDLFNRSSEDVKSLHYQDIPEWDSVGHMSLVAALEEAFDIMMDTDDIIDFESYEKGIEILKKYDVQL